MVVGPSITPVVFAIYILTKVWRAMQEVLTRQTPPGVILLELHPHDMEAHGYEGGAVAMLQSLYALGYTDISHSGCVMPFSVSAAMAAV